MSVADWVGVTTLIVGVVGAALGAFWARRQPRNRDAEGTFTHAPHSVGLDEESASLIRRLVDAVHRLSRSIDDHAETVSRHRHAVGDNTAEHRRQD